MSNEIRMGSFVARLQEGHALVVDVREPWEYRPGHVPGAVNLPLSTLPTRLSELPRDREVYVICEAGGRSLQAAQLMRAVGVDATSVAGGTAAWIAGGLPVRTAA